MTSVSAQMIRFRHSLVQCTGDLHRTSKLDGGILTVVFLVALALYALRPPSDEGKIISTC